jgi:hypothetical protein
VCAGRYRVGVPDGPPSRRRPLAVAALALTAAAGAGVVAAVARDADPPPPPPATAAQVRALLGDPRPGEGVSGVIQVDQSVVPGSSLARFALPDGSVRGRFWVLAPDRWRVELQGTGHDWQIVREGGTVSVYWDGGQTRYEIPASLLPASVASIGPVRVSAPRPTVQAGRPAHEVVYRPVAPGSLVRAVRVTADAATGVPLALRIDSTRTDTPVLDVRATSVDTGGVDPRAVRLDPPATASTVRVGTLLQAGLGLGAVTVLGRGWERAVRLPAGAVPDALRGALGGVGGAGVGGVTETPLLTALVTGSPEALVVGPVTAPTLRRLAGD